MENKYKELMNFIKTDKEKAIDIYKYLISKGININIENELKNDKIYNLQLEIEKYLEKENLSLEDFLKELERQNIRIKALKSQYEY